MKNNKTSKPRKYIPSRSVRLQNNLIGASYLVVLAMSISVLGYVHNTSMEIAIMEQDLQLMHNNFEEQQIASANKSRGIWEVLDAQADSMKAEIEEEYYNNLRVQEQSRRENEQEFETMKQAEELEQLEEAEAAKHIETRKELHDNYEVPVTEEAEPVQNSTDFKLIRCTGYCDVGYTASGEWTRDGIAAGKKEWLGKTIALFSVDANGNIGEKIGEYTFLDTGAGIDTDGDGKGDTIKNGKSIDLWHSTEEACYSFSSKYGDYVYMTFVD